MSSGLTIVINGGHPAGADLPIRAALEIRDPPHIVRSESRAQNIAPMRLTLNVGGRLSVGSSISQRFNALNVNLWSRADSADWADEETGERLLKGVRRSRRSRFISLPR